MKEYIEAELKHNALFQAHVSQVLIPMEKHASLRNGKRMVKDKISLPGYVFVEALSLVMSLTCCVLRQTFWASSEDWTIRHRYHSLILTVCLEMPRNLNLRTK